MFCKLHSMYVILLVQDINLRSFMVFAWTTQNPENKRGNLNAKKKLDITKKKKKKNTIDGRLPKSKGVLCSKSDIGTLFSLGKMGNYSLVLHCGI